MAYLLYIFMNTELRCCDIYFSVQLCCGAGAAALHALGKLGKWGDAKMGVTAQQRERRLKSA